MKLSSAVVLALFGYSALIGSASAATLMYTETYLLGDGDSKVSARDAIIANIKKKAADQAGTYVESEKLLLQGNLSEKVRMLSAALVKVSPVSERINMSSTGVVSLELTARATFDELELKKRIAAIQADARKDQAIARLNAANQVLQDKLAAVQMEMQSKSLNAQKVSQLLKRQIDLTQEINSNEQAVSSVFEKGTLLHIAASANQESALLKKDFAAAYTEAWELLSSKLKPSVASVRDASDHVEVTVSVPDLPQKYEQMTQIVGTNVKAPHGTVWLTYLDLKDKPEKFKSDLIDKATVIDSMPVFLQVSVVNTKVSVPFFGIGETNFISDEIQPRPFAADEFKAAIVSNRYTKQVIGFFEKEPHTATSYWVKNGIYYFKLRLSRHEAAEADTVKASFVIGGKQKS